MKISMHTTVWDGRPFDDQALEKERRKRMSDVVLVSDLADKYDRDAASFLKLLKRNKVELLFATDPVSGQRRRCVLAASIQDLDAIVWGDNKVVSIAEAVDTLKQ